MIALELFSGSQSFRKVAEPLKIKCYSLDIQQVGNLQTEFLCDYMDFDVTKLDFVPDFVWASPDCAAFSKAAGKTHFDKGSIEPKTEKAIKSIAVVEKLIADLVYLQGKNPNIKIWIENPQGKMAWLDCMQPDTLFNKHPIAGFRVVEIDQCAYGREFQKTTHIFTNDPIFNGKRCVGANCHHARNNDGASAWKRHEWENIEMGGGTHNGESYKNGLNGGYWTLARIPPKLIETILKPYATL